MANLNIPQESIEKVITSAREKFYLSKAEATVIRTNAFFDLQTLFRLHCFIQDWNSYDCYDLDEVEMRTEIMGQSVVDALMEYPFNPEKVFFLANAIILQRPAKSIPDLFMEKSNPTKEVSFSIPSDLYNCYIQFFQAGKSGQCEYGFTAPTDIVIERFAADYPEFFSAIITYIAMMIEGIVFYRVALLKGLSGILYQKELLPVISALSKDTNYEVQEGVIRLFEHWQVSEGISILENMDLRHNDLASYRVEVIKLLNDLKPN